MTPTEQASQNQENLAGRRPLKTRSNVLARRLSSYLVQKDISPNQISLLSMAFALVGALAIWQIHSTESQFGYVFLSIVGVLGIQGRLLCNLMDGLVAIEGQ